MLHRPDGVTNIRALETTLPSQQIVRHGLCIIFLQQSASITPLTKVCNTFYIYSSYTCIAFSDTTLVSIGTAETDFAVVKEHIKQQGSVDVLSLKSYLIGPSRVGKTTTRRRLTGESTTCHPTRSFLAQASMFL